MGLYNHTSTCLATNVGRVRTNNEDALAEDAELGLIVLADGMGGHNAGEVASTIATTTIVEEVRRNWDRDPTVSPTANHSARAELLGSAVQAAHQRIRAKAESNPECAGMGTTATACLLIRDRLIIAHIGDSRAYRWRDGLLSQLTQDHSRLEELVASGHYSREDATRLIPKNILTRALGVEDSANIDLIEDRLQTGDLLLLCSDGLTDMLDDERIAAVLDASDSNLQATGHKLIDGALAAGGRDNVSIALARVETIVSAGPANHHWRDRLKQWWRN